MSLKALKRKIVSSSEESSKSISSFASSVSHFRGQEENLLRIKVSVATDFSHIVPLAQESEYDFYLPEFDEGRIMSFRPLDHANLSIYQKKFLNKLKLVLINNHTSSEESNFEKLIDDMTVFIYDHMNLDDGERLMMKPCNLYMSIGEETFAANTDREGRKSDSEIIWVMCEDKHVNSRSYKHGEIQLICCMIAAFQHNASVDDVIRFQKMIGIRVVGDKFYFYSIINPSDYIEDLSRGLPKRDLTVIKYPQNGLSISKPDERKIILRSLNSIKEYAISDY